MSEVDPMTFEGKKHHFEIAEPTMDDVQELGQMQLRSWIETYQNSGHDEAWVRDAIGYVADESGDEFRRNLYQRVIDRDENIYYRVVKDTDGRIVGFCHAEKHRDKPEDVLEGLYLLARVQGEGLGSKLMQGALNWFKPERRVKLSVIEYNQPAIDFYERAGFKVVPEKRTHFKDDVYAIDMVREVA